MRSMRRNEGQAAAELVALLPLAALLLAGAWQLVARRSRGLGRRLRRAGGGARSGARR